MLQALVPVVAVVVSLLAWLLAAEAQQAGKVYRIGVLADGSLTDPRSRPMLDAFRQGLHDLGYVDGRNAVIELRSSDGLSERLAPLAAELVRLGPDILVAGGTGPALALKRATATIPIVAVSSDAVGSGLVATLARPGGNVTGLSNLAPELGGKRLQLLKEILPALSRVAVLWNGASSSTRPVVQEAEVAARGLGVELQSVQVRRRGDFDAAFAAITRGRAEALFVVFDPLTLVALPRIVEFARDKRLPAIYGIREFADAGGLLSYGVNLPDLGRRMGSYIDKILRGAKPADLPVEQPTRFELVINVKTAKALGLTIPQSVLLRADHVIE